MNVLPLTRERNALLRLALLHLKRDRHRTIEWARKDLRGQQLRQVLVDAGDEIRAIDALLTDLDALTIRRRFTDPAAAPATAADALAHTLPDTPTADGLDSTDCTGVLKGNTDIVCERGEGRDG